MVATWAGWLAVMKAGCWAAMMAKGLVGGTVVYSGEKTVARLAVQKVYRKVESTVATWAGWLAVMKAGCWAAMMVEELVAGTAVCLVEKTVARLVVQ